MICYVMIGYIMLCAATVMLCFGMLCYVMVCLCDLVIWLMAMVMLRCVTLC